MYKLLAPFVLAVAPTAAFAQIPVSCDTCVTDAQFRERAVQEEAITHTGGTFLVYNLARNLVQKWHIPASGTGTSPDNAAAPREASAADGTRLPVEDQVQAEVGKAQRLETAGGSGFRPIHIVPVERLKLPAADSSSVYDMMRDDTLKAQIASALGDIDILQSSVGADAMASMVDVMWMPADTLGSRQKAGFNLRLVMSDGSHIDAHLDVPSTTADLQDDTARTRDGQLIPSRLDQLQGTWLATPSDDLEAIAAHMQYLGASVVVESAGAASASITCRDAVCIRRMRN